MTDEQKIKLYEENMIEIVKDNVPMVARDLMDVMKYHMLKLNIKYEGDESEQAATFMTISMMASFNCMGNIVLSLFPGEEGSKKVMNKICKDMRITFDDLLKANYKNVQA
jgi:hypothetical protein